MEKFQRLAEGVRRIKWFDLAFSFTYDCNMSERDGGWRPPEPRTNAWDEIEGIDYQADEPVKHHHRPVSKIKRLVAAGAALLALAGAAVGMGRAQSSSGEGEERVDSPVVLPQPQEEPSFPSRESEDASSEESQSEQEDSSRCCGGR